MPPADYSSAFTLFSSRLYRLLLSAYPRDLRIEFGQEIAEAFDLQLCDSYRSHGVAGALRVWAQALSEFITIALPFQIRSLLAPCIGAAAAATAFSALMTMCSGIDRGWTHPLKPQRILVSTEPGARHCWMVRLAVRADVHGSRDRDNPTYFRCAPRSH